MSDSIAVIPKTRPPLDPEFVPASLWNRNFRAAVAASGATRKLAIALERQDHSVSTYHTVVFPHEGRYAPLNQRYAERLTKFLLWQRGGRKITVAGDAGIAQYLREVYSPAGARAFDYDFMGDLVYGAPMEIVGAAYDNAPESSETGSALGRHLDGCRIGFDLGGSDRKCAAVRDGELVHTEEIAWDPYFKTDPQYHIR